MSMFATMAEFYRFVKQPDKQDSIHPHMYNFALLSLISCKSSGVMSTGAACIIAFGPIDILCRGP
jgi:hypothetical protein